MSLHNMLGIRKSNKIKRVTITGTLKEFDVLFGKDGVDVFTLAVYNHGELDLNGSVIHKIKTGKIL